MPQQEAPSTSDEKKMKKMQRMADQFREEGMEMQALELEQFMDQYGSSGNLAAIFSDGSEDENDENDDVDKYVGEDDDEGRNGAGMGSDAGRKDAEEAFDARNFVAAKRHSKKTGGQQGVPADAMSFLTSRLQARGLNADGSVASQELRQEFRNQGKAGLSLESEEPLANDLDEPQPREHWLPHPAKGSLEDIDVSDEEDAEEESSPAPKECHAKVPEAASAGVGMGGMRFEGPPPLHQAARRGDHKAVQAILQENRARNVNAVDEDGETALATACMEGHTQVARLLLEAKASLEACDSEGTPPLIAAIAKKHVALAEELLERGSRVDSREDDFGMSPLHMALSRQLHALAQSLLSRKASLASLDDALESPLHIAVKKDDPVALNFLLEAKADVNLDGEPGVGLTPLSLAVELAREGACLALLEAKPNPNPN